jgi:predicted nucleotidyltransferase
MLALQSLPAEEEDRFSDVLGEVGQVLNQASIAHALIGGIASSVLGRPRATRDIDVFVRPDHADAALVALGASGYETDRLDAAWIFKATKHGVQVDLIFYTRYGIYLDDAMVEHTRVSKYRGAEVRVVSPEDLLIMKAVAHDEATPRHWHDALGLVGRGDLDWEYLVLRSRRAQRRVLSLLLYAQSLDYFIPGRVIDALCRRIIEE